MLIRNALHATYTPGYLVYYSSGSLWAAPFDAKSAQLTRLPSSSPRTWPGSTFSLITPFRRRERWSTLPARVTPARNLVWVDRKGGARKIDAPAEDYVDPSISPDGKHFVVCVRTVTEQALAVYDVGRGVMMRMSGNHLRNAAPIWGPDSKTLYFDAGGQGASWVFIACRPMAALRRCSSGRCHPTRTSRRFWATRPVSCSTIPRPTPIYGL